MLVLYGIGASPILDLNFFNTSDSYIITYFHSMTTSSVKITLLKQMYVIVLMIISHPITTNDEDFISVDSMHYGGEVYFCHRWPLPLRYYILVMFVQECFPKLSTTSRWLSSLRRQFQVLVIKVVGSNPNLDINISPVRLNISISITLAFQFK